MINRATILIICLLLVSVYCKAQPINDRCSKALLISISNNAFDTGHFFGQTVLLDDATRDKGENCDESIKKLGTCDKTVWYKFYIPTTRNVEVTLNQQDSIIPQIFAGFTIYESKNCDINQGNLSEQLIPLGKFGSSGNSCLQAGWYYIQVSAKQRTIGDIWVNLRISLINSPLHNDFSTPKEIPVPVNSTKHHNVPTECTSLESNEYLGPNNDSLYTKSIWLKLRLKQNTFNNSILFSLNRDAFKYRIFHKAPTAQSLLSQKPFIDGSNYYIHKQECSRQDRDSIFYVQVIVKKQITNITIGISSHNYYSDDWTNPKTTTAHINLVHGINSNFTRRFICDGLLSNNICKPLIPDYLVNPKYSYYDTQRHAGYLTLNCPEDGQLTFSYSNASVGMSYLLYKGDIRNSCNLELVYSTIGNSSLNYCLKKGFYSLVAVHNLQALKGSNARVNFYYRFYRKKTVPIEHYSPFNPESLGEFDNTKQNPRLSSKILNFSPSDQTIKVDTFEKSGRMIFREFYCKYKSLVEIRHSNSGSVYIFKGRSTNRNLALTPGTSYANNTGKDISCLVLESGYYTIVSILDTSTSSLWNTNCTNLSQVRIHTEIECMGRYANTEPDNAIELNGLSDLLSNSTKKNNLSYLYQLPMCKDCKKATLSQPTISCNENIVLGLDKNERLFYYYVFYIDQNSEIVVPQGSILYRGNVNLNNTICNDSNAIIDKCGNGTTYCNLKGKTYYTLVTLHQPSSLYLTATPHIKTPNNFIQDSYDFGHISSNLNTSSSLSPITCHTNRANLRNNQWGISKIQFLDTLDKRRWHSYQKTLWYTFTVEGGGKIDLTNNYNSQYGSFLVFKYNSDFNIDFYALLQNGLDTSTHLFEPINSVNGSSNRISFINKGCTENRYFVQYNPNAKLPYNVKYDVRINLKVTFEPSKLTLGNNCSNAVKSDIKTFGNYKPSTDNICHNYGYSPFEDSNRADLKSTWYVINIDSLYKTDLQVKYTSTNNRLEKFVMYAGGCDALTKVAEVENQFNYFTLSCMGKGKYYVQAITKNSVAGELRFQFNAFNPLNLNCKPFDFEQPIAQFDIKGGCNSDTVYLHNISTQGDSIENYWYLNNKLITQVLHPKISILNQGFAVGDNIIKLVVKNLNSNRFSDSISKTYTYDTIPFYARIQAPTVFTCKDTIKLSIITNYPYKANYEWGPEYRFSNPFKKEQVLQNVNSLLITLKVSSENCLFHDTIHLQPSKPTNIFSDTSLCSNQGKITYDLSGFNTLYHNNILITSSSLTIDKPGLHFLLYNYQGCIFRDTIELFFASKKDTLFQDDDLTICNLEPKNYTYDKYLIDLLWNTGDTGRTITIAKPNKYKLFGSIDGCAKQDFTLNVKNESLPKRFLRDTLICEQEKFIYPANYFGFPIIDKFPNLDSVLIDKNTEIKITIGTDHCKQKDSALIRMIYAPTLMVDSPFCFTSKNTLILDAQNAQQYRWLNSNNSGQFYIATGYKDYTVERLNMDRCKDTIIFSVTEHCPTSFFVPNTFSPNNDLRNQVFKPVISGTFKSYSMTILNRWGKIIYSNNSNGEWDGTYMGKPVFDGVYVVIININTQSETIPYYGTLTLIR